MKRFFQLMFITLILLSLILSLSSSGPAAPVELNDKVIHCFSYFMLIMMLDFSWRSGEKLFLKFVVVLTYSCLIEYAQGFIPGRDMSIADIVANGVGALLFISCVPLLKRRMVYTILKLK